MSNPFMAASVSPKPPTSGPLVPLHFFRCCPRHHLHLHEFPEATNGRGLIELRCECRQPHFVREWEVCDSRGTVYYTATEHGIVAIGRRPRSLPITPSPVPDDPDPPGRSRPPGRRSWTNRGKERRKQIRRMMRGVLPSHRLVGNLEQILSRYNQQMWS
jgi:hypothetical protein